MKESEMLAALDDVLAPKQEEKPKALAPGDFRTVKEELFYVCEEETNAARLEALEAEARAKRGHKAKIGF